MHLDRFMHLSQKLVGVTLRGKWNGGFHVFEHEILLRNRMELTMAKSL